LDRKNTMISIILPVWKAAPEYFSSSLKSILDQSYNDLEILIIFQKSHTNLDDKIMNILDGNSDDHRLKIIIRETPAFIDALNLGIQKAEGQFIARMDADDISEKNRFEEQLEFLRTHNFSMVGSQVTSIDEQGNVIGHIDFPTSHDEIRHKIMFHNPFAHPSILLRREVFEKIGLYNPKFEGAEDYDLYFRIISKNFRVGNVPEYLIRLRETPNSLMRGSGWFKKRLRYWQVKRDAVFKHGFTKPSDIAYFSISPLVILLSPKMAIILKNKIAYNRH